MPTASTAGGRSATSLPLAPHIQHHHVKTTEDWPEKLVLLAPLEARPTHWAPGTPTRDGHTVPCDGGPPQCEWCRPNIEKRVNYYAPALLAEELQGETLWRRIVLCVPKRTMEKHVGNIRGAVQFAWCKRRRVYLEFSTHCYSCDEPAFAIQPVLDLVWGVEGASKAVFDLRTSLTEEPIPPVISKPDDPAIKLAAIQSQLEEMQRQIDEGNAERERLKAAGRWPGSRKSLDSYRDDFAKSGTVHRNGTPPQQPTSETGDAPKGGAE